MSGVIDGLAELVRGVVDLAIPPLCTACGEYTDSSTGLCDVCIRRIDRYEYPVCLQCEQPILSGSVCPQCGKGAMVLLAYGNYVDPLKEAVHQFKFRGVTRVAGFFAQEIVTKFAVEIQSLKPATVVPIPLHPSREHARGFNQAEVFARALAARLDLDMEADLLIRIKKGKPHSRLADAARARNIKGAFAATAETPDSDRIILVDDVVTGGHTVREARSELVKAGFDVPAVISIAHGR
jgi:ComF family protein